MKTDALTGHDERTRNKGEKQYSRIKEIVVV